MKNMQVVFRTGKDEGIAIDRIGARNLAKMVAAMEKPIGGFATTMLSATVGGVPGVMFAELERDGNFSSPDAFSGTSFDVPLDTRERVVDVYMRDNYGEKIYSVSCGYTNSLDAVVLLAPFFPTRIKKGYGSGYDAEIDLGNGVKLSSPIHMWDVNTPEERIRYVERVARNLGVRTIDTE